MKKHVVKFIFFLSLIFPISTYALDDTYNDHPGCTYSEISELKKKVMLVDYYYDYNDLTLMNLTFSNFKEEFYAKDDYGNVLKYLNNGIITKDGYKDNQTLKISFYANSNTCNNELLYVLTIKLPRYNPYYKDKECEQINSDDFLLCGKWYPSIVSRNDFLEKLFNYKNDLERKNDKNEVEEIKKVEKSYLDFLYKNYEIFLIFIALILFISIIVSKVKNKRKQVV